MTQPVFDRALAKMNAPTNHSEFRFSRGMPLLKCASGEIVHNEVGNFHHGGDSLPMAGKEGLEACQGLEIAKRTLVRAALDHFPGIYLITPFSI